MPSKLLLANLQHLLYHMRYRNKLSNIPTILLGYQSKFSSGRHSVAPLSFQLCFLPLSDCLSRFYTVCHFLLGVL